MTTQEITQRDRADMRAYLRHHDVQGGAVTLIDALIRLFRSLEDEPQEKKA